MFSIPSFKFLQIFSRIYRFNSLKKVDIVFIYVAQGFNIFQVYQYFTIYRRYFVLKFEHFHEYLIQYPLKSGGIKEHFKRVKVPGTAPY